MALWKAKTRVWVRAEGVASLCSNYQPKRMNSYNVQIQNEISNLIVQADSTNMAQTVISKKRESFRVGKYYLGLIRASRKPLQMDDNQVAD
ncbi:hypothetical protein C4D60_Mb04t12520 [Musa balbisiana]|uniref:Uncharacterized protein n=1 Tax=Musa balbisiana TaxID=52838 RepID=A0A4V4H9Q0_MUSBA|nr:hypothetical protein C4D60_Mb04t12520 [Musa balbisiana]